MHEDDEFFLKNDKKKKSTNAFSVAMVILLWLWEYRKSNNGNKTCVK